MREGLINLVLDGITFEETERIREILHVLITSGGIHVKNGQTIIHFDHDGTVQEIEVHQKRWKRNKVNTPYKDIKVELTK